MSALLSSEDLNDFISPGVACIKPVEVSKTSQTADIQIDSVSGQAYEVSLDGTTTTDLSAAQISLSDCLACSGCITSAESVLVSLQSHTELLNAVKNNQILPEDQRKQFVVSISHQTRVSLATAYNITVDEADRRLATLFVEILGFKYVVGMGLGREISLDYSAREVLERMVSINGESNGKPILSSSCPGWICYVEKTHQYIIPYLSAVKSPQQITGSLLKEMISHELNLTKDKIYHLSVMPCFDKKLEAARTEHTTENNNHDHNDRIKDVDCVITTKEIIQLLLDSSLTFEGLARPEISDNEFATALTQRLTPKNWPSARSWASHEGSSSGGYLHHILTTMQSHFATSQGVSTTIKVIAGKNSDIVEYHIVDANDPERVLSKSAQIYGFRNIQNLVRKLKPNSAGGVGGGGGGGLSARRLARKSATTNTISVIDPTSWAYVEVMACPGGCINGGGQIGAPTDINIKEWKDKAELIYNSMPRLPVDSQSIHQFIEHNWGYDKVDQLVSTGYTAVISDEAVANHALTLGSKW